MMMNTTAPAVNNRLNFLISYISAISLKLATKTYMHMRMRKRTQGMLKVCDKKNDLNTGGVVVCVGMYM